MGWVQHDESKGREVWACCLLRSAVLPLGRIGRKRVGLVCAGPGEFVCSGWAEMIWVTDGIVKFHATVNILILLLNIVMNFS
jgi:hypothetical protein